MMTLGDRRTSMPFCTAAAVALAACALLAGCGEASSPKATAQTEPASVHTEQASVPTVTEKSVTPPSPEVVLSRTKSTARSSKGSVLVRRTDTVYTGRVVQSGASTPASSGDDTSPPGQRQLGPNPCGLVSKATAQALVGARLASRTVAPLGPTCIFKFAHTTRQITIAVEPVSFTAISRELGRRQRMTVSGRPAFCGTRGTQTLFVSLRGGGVLNVTAPCHVAQRLAAKALTRLHE
jgi:hypothetical protein